MLTWRVFAETVAYCLIIQLCSSSTATADTYTKLASMKTFRELEKLPPDQQQKLITQVLKETLPAAKDDLSINEIRPLLYQSGVITSEEATELLGIFTGEEKITRLYTEMLPKKGAERLKKFMRILYDTGWDIPSHVRHHGVLSIKLSVSKLAVDLCFMYTFRTSVYRSGVLGQYLIYMRVKRLQREPLYQWSTQSHSKML